MMSYSYCFQSKMGEYFVIGLHAIEIDKKKDRIENEV